MTIAAADMPVVNAMRRAVPACGRLTDEQLVTMAKAAVGVLFRRTALPNLTVEQAELAEAAVAQHQVRDAGTD